MPTKNKGEGRHCSVCGKKGETCPKHLEQMRVLQRNKRNRRRERGQCIECREPVVTTVRCEFHRNLKNERDREYSRRKRERGKEDVNANSG